MLKVAILGCGQIGSRHLQSLASLKEPALIYLYDISHKAIEVAKERFAEVLSDTQNDQFEIKDGQLKNIDPNIDLAIFAGTSKERAHLTRELLLISTPKYIFFEKFLFTEKVDYEDIGRLLASKNIKAWVNQWFSSSQGYRSVADFFGSNNPVSMKVYGNDWGLGCNSCHVLELFDFLNHRGKLTLLSSDLDEGVLEGTRPGYFELTGEIALQSENGAVLEIGSKRTKMDGEIYIDFFNGEKSVYTVLDGYELTCRYGENEEASSAKYTVPFQSEMTAGLLENLLLSSECGLPGYSRSAEQHLLLMKCFEEHFEKESGWSGNGCLIT